MTTPQAKRAAALKTMETYDGQETANFCLTSKPPRVSGNSP
ncbi:hypothetical protein [uncultured Hyphomonas sp.]|nr:hypothetical protein [uncultured Hyphomonas sp.]